MKFRTFFVAPARPWRAEGVGPRVTWIVLGFIELSLLLKVIREDAINKPAPH